MYLLLFSLVLLLVYKMRYNSNKELFFTKEDDNRFRGAFCVIIMLVHVPEQFQNPIQDAIGSFAYIGVTYFFMSSAYGISYGLKHKENYLSHFWKNRFINLLIPVLVCNLFRFAINSFCDRSFNYLDLISIDNWVKVLLLYYFIFWSVHIFESKSGKLSDTQSDFLICVVIVLLSLIDELTSFKLTMIWPTESIGFVYGIILARFYTKINEWITKCWWIKSIICMCIGVAVGLLYLRLKNIFFFGDYILKIILGFSLMMLLVLVEGRFFIGNRVLDFLGKISYEIYLTHLFIFSLMFKLLNNNLFKYFIVISLTSCILTAAIVHFVNEKIKQMIQYLHKKILD